MLETQHIDAKNLAEGQKALLVKFDDKETMASVMETVGSLMKLYDMQQGPYLLTYLPPGPISSDPLPQHGYFGLMTPESK